MKVSAEAVIELDRDREKVFQAAIDADMMPKIFRGAGPVRAIEKVSVVGGGQMEKGVVRRLEMADGSTLDEEIIEFEPPLKFAYRITGLKPPLGLLVGQMGGRWTFTPYGSGTRVAWTYWGELRTPLFYGIARPLFDIFMKRAMQECLQRLKDQM